MLKAVVVKDLDYTDLDGKAKYIPSGTKIKVGEIPRGNKALMPDGTIGIASSNFFFGLLDGFAFDIQSHEFAIEQ